MRCGRAFPSKRRMPERFMRRILPFLAFALQRLRTARPDVVDTVVGLAIAGVALVQVAPDLHGAAPTGVSVLGIAALTGGLAWRRRHPLLLVPVAVTIIVAQAGLAEHVPLPDAALLAYLLIDYSVGAHTGRRSAVVGLLVLVAGIFAYTLISSAAGSFSPVFPLVVGLPPWFAGRALRARRELSIKLADRSGQLEAEREELADLAVRSERARIARELHDVVAHCVSLMVIQAAGGQRVVEADPNAAMHALDAIVHAGDQALRELAHLVGLLDGLAASGATSELGLARLGELVSRAEQAGMRVTLAAEGATVLPPAIDAAAFRIVQEGITNAVKHAGPGALRVSARRSEHQLELLDDGRSMPPSPAILSGGHGLSGMRERVELLGGTLEAGPAQAGGWALRASLPLAHEEQPRALANQPSLA